MGSPMSHILEKLVTEDNQNKPMTEFHHSPKFWKRYVNDTYPYHQSRVFANCSTISIFERHWTYFFLRVSGGSDKIHKVLKPFSVVDVSGPQVFQAVRRMSQSKITWMANCSSAQQMHLDVSSMPQRCRHVPKPPTPVLNLFSATRRLRGSSEPDGRRTAGVTRNWAGGVAFARAVLHDSSRLKPEFISWTYCSARTRNRKW